MGKIVQEGEGKERKAGIPGIHTVCCGAQRCQ